MLFLMIPMIIIGLLRFLFIPEKYEVDAKDEQGHAQRTRLADVKQVLSHNPYIYIVGLILLVSNFVTNMGVGQYYYRYIVGDLSLMGMMAAVQILGVLLSAAGYISSDTIVTQPDSAINMIRSLNGLIPAML